MIKIRKSKSKYGIHVIVVSATCGFEDGLTCGWMIKHAPAANPSDSFTWQLGQAQTFMSSPYSPRSDASQVQLYK